MTNILFMRKLIRLKHVSCSLLFLATLFLTNEMRAQNILVNTATLEGVDITPDNVFGFQIQSMESKDIRSRIEGTIRFRNSNHSIKYNFLYTLKPGLNLFDANAVHPNWTFSSSALRELFLNYKVLPQGTYQYCVQVIPNVGSSESTGDNLMDDCLYKQSKDLFSIMLLEPENDAKLYEYNPMLSWVATYPFVSELTYRVRVAEIKQGQNTENAITRNNPHYSEKNIMTSAITYPVYAKPLQTWQPYAWTVDAYYKGLLLGGAQPWKFTIVEDSLLKSIPRDVPYIHINLEKNGTESYAVGVVKIKYVLDDSKQDILSLSLRDKADKEIPLKQKTLDARYGDNRYIVNLKDDANLKHKGRYTLNVTNKAGTSYQLKFIYINPDLLP